ncbi:MAG: DUF3769 domain-containing protein [Cyanobium sp.]
MAAGLSCGAIAADLGVGVPAAALPLTPPPPVESAGPDLALPATAAALSREEAASATPARGSHLPAAAGLDPGSGGFRLARNGEPALAVPSETAVTPARAGAGQDTPLPAAPDTAQAPVGTPPAPAQPAAAGGPSSPAPTPGLTPGAGPGTADRPAGSGRPPSQAALVAGVPPELDLQADQQTYDGQLRRFSGNGNVSALIAGGRLMADRIEIDLDSRTVHAFGRVRFQRGQQYLQASRLRYSLLEGRGEMQDVYGVLDLDGAASDLDLAQPPSSPLPPAEAISCAPPLPPPPQWHPYPWAATAWAGQMFAANFGDTFIFKGRLRPEYLTGVGLQRRLLDAGPFALELDANLLGHRAIEQPGGPFNQATPYGDTPAQSFSDVTLGIGGRLWLRPWLNLYFVEGVSLLSGNSNYERTFRENYSRFLNYLAFEVEALVSPRVSAVGRIHHRSGAYGLYSGVSEGSNAYLLGLRYRWGTPAAIQPSLELPPAQGCPGAPPPGPTGPLPLAEQLDAVAQGAAAPGSSSASTSAATTTAAATTNDPGTPNAPAASASPRRRDPWSLAREQERLRREAIARIDQRVSDVQFQQSLIAERRRGVQPRQSEPEEVGRFGGVRPPQLASLNTRESRQLVRGTISRWRLQARLLRFTPNSFSGDRVAFTNDPFTPAQAWLDSTNVVATLMPSGDTVIRADRNRLRLEDRLPLAVRRQVTIEKQEEVDNRLVLAYDKTDRDGYYAGYNIPIDFGKNVSLLLQPQFLAQRAINSSTSVYPRPGRPVQARPITQPATTSDLFGLEAVLESSLLGFKSQAQLELSTFNSEHVADGTRSWGDMERRVTLPLLGPSVWRLFGAYRYRIWNGSLGEQDVYTAYGSSLDRTGTLPNWGKLSSNYYWRIGVGNYQATPADSLRFNDLWRGNAIGSLNASLPLWTGKPAPATAARGLQNSATPIVPGLSLNANLLGTVAYYGDGTHQNTLTLSGGPSLTLGHFEKSFLDFTQLTLTASGTLRSGLSPFGFDQAIDLGTFGIGLTQQIVGPLVFNGGIGLNVDRGSRYFGDTTSSYVELRWQRRAYEIGIFYSPYEGIGGVRVKLNDFNYKGPGVPFVPWDPASAVRRRPF